MRRIPTVVPLLTLLFFVFSLAGNALIADPGFSNIAFAQKKQDAKFKQKKSAQKKKKNKRDRDKDKDDDRGNNGIPKKIATLQAEINALEQELANIELTPGPQGIPGTPGTNGTNGADGAEGPQGVAGTNGTNGIDGVGDVRIVNVTASPSQPNGPYDSNTSYSASSACTTPDMPIDAGILNNPNTPTRIVASVTKLDPINRATEFKIVRDDTNIQTGDIIHLPVVFFVKCATPSVYMAATPIIPEPSVVFVTEATFQPGSGFLSIVQNACNAEAAAAGLPGAYLPWLSSASSSPSTFPGFKNPAGYVTPDGTMVASNYPDLTDGFLTSPINRYANAQLTSSDSNLIVWTGTTPDGRTANHTCNNWMAHTGASSGFFGYYGFVNEQFERGGERRANAWTYATAGPCSSALRAYCFQQTP